MPNSTANYLARRAYWTQQAEAGKNFDCVPVPQPNGPPRKFTYKSLQKDPYAQRECIAQLAYSESRAVGGRRKSRKSRSRKSRSRKSRRR